MTTKEQVKFTCSFLHRLLNCDDDQIFRSPIVRIMGTEPDLVVRIVFQREFIVEESSFSILVEIAVSAAPLVDLILISVSIIELVSEQLIHCIVFYELSPEFYDPFITDLSGRIKLRTFRKSPVIRLI